MKNKLIQYLVKSLLRAVTEDDILTITNRGWYKGKRKLSEEEVQFLKDEAKSISDSLLWKLMNDELRYLANLRMFEKSAEPGNTVFGRAMLYDLEIIRQYVERVKTL